MKNQETRLCGNERLKVDFLEFFSVERTFVFVAVEEEDDDDDDDDGFILLISCIIELLFDGNIDWVNDDDGDRGIGVIGDGPDGIENGVIGDEILNVPCWGENNEDVNGSFIVSSFDKLWRDIIGEVWGDKSSIAPINGDCNNVES